MTAIQNSKALPLIRARFEKWLKEKCDALGLDITTYDLEREFIDLSDLEEIEARDRFMENHPELLPVKSSTEKPARLSTHWQNDYKNYLEAFRAFCIMCGNEYMNEGDSFYCSPTCKPKPSVVIIQGLTH